MTLLIVALVAFLLGAAYGGWSVDEWWENRYGDTIRKSQEVRP